MPQKPKAVFSFHDLVRLAVYDLHDDLLRAPVKAFAPFKTDTPTHPAEVEIHPLDGALFSSVKLSQYKNPARLWFDVDAEGRPLLISGYRGHIDMVIQPHDPVRLFVADREEAADKMMDLVHLCLMVALSRRKAVLFKGALVRRANRTVILAGVSGAGKTSLLLHMLADGWDYAADNTFLMDGGQAFDFRTRLVYHDYHALAFPGMFQRLPDMHERAGSVDRRNKLRRLGTRWLPHYLLNNSRLHHYLNPYSSCAPQDLFPNLTTFRSGRPDMVVILQPGRETRFEEAGTAPALRQLKLMHQMAWAEFDEINRLTELNTGTPLYEFGPALQANLHGVCFRRYYTPYGGDVPALYRGLNAKIATAFNPDAFQSRQEERA